MNDRTIPNPGARPDNETTEAAAAASVQGIFDSIAPRYDLLNHLLSFGLAKLWWNAAARTFHATLADPNTHTLDICCGTGDMTRALAAYRPANAAPLTGLDFSAAMLDRARTKYAAINAVWVEGDAMHLPYPDNSFDLVTAAFGFRNLTNYAAGLREIHRVLRPGGQLGILECNQPGGLSGALYTLYFRYILPVIGGVLSGDMRAYRYLPESVARFPRPPQMLALMSDAGFHHPTWDGYFLHAAGLYRGVKQ